MNFLTWLAIAVAIIVPVAIYIFNDKGHEKLKGESDDDKRADA